MAHQLIIQEHLIESILVHEYRVLNVSMLVGQVLEQILAGYGWRRTDMGPVRWNLVQYQEEGEGLVLILYWI